MRTSNQWKSHKRKPEMLLIGLCPSTKVASEKMEISQVRQKDQWTIQSPTDTCKRYFDKKVKTRCLRETQHKKVNTVQRAHSHKSQMCKLQAKIVFIDSQPHEYRCANTCQKRSSYQVNRPYYKCIINWSANFPSNVTSPSRQRVVRKVFWAVFLSPNQMED
jgi:hypothetical protein